MLRLTLGLALAAAPSLVASEDPPPEHMKWMKETGELQGKIRKGVEVEASAKRIAEIYKDVEAFWAKRSSEVATKAAKDTQQAALALATAAASGDAAATTAAGRAMGGGCRTCHDAHREKVDETTYKIK